MRKIYVVIFIFFSLSGIIEADNFDDIMELIKNHQYPLAETNLNELLIKEPSNIRYLDTLSDVYISQNKFREAKETCIRMSELKPDDFNITIKISRISSWMGDFKDSVKYYNKAIEIHKDDISPFIEKARVLGWWGKYGKAKKAYLQTYLEFPQDWIKSESEGKKDLWNGKLDSAINNFEKSLESKPDNTEILFDLAQIYSYGEDYKKAGKYYSELLKVNPYHTAAEKARQKNQIQIDALNINTGTNYWDAQSFERNTDVEVTSMYFDVNKKVNNLRLGANISREFFRFEKNDNKLEQNSAGLSVSYQKPLVFGVGSGFTKRSLADKEGERESYYAYIWYRFLWNINLNANFLKNNMISNYGNIADDLNDTSNLVKIEYQPKDFIIIGGGLRTGEISDGNSYQTNNYYAKLLIMKFPGNLYTIFERENIQYDNKSTEYFAPGNYSNISSLTSLRQNIGSEGQYYGANNIYYELKYKILYDSNDEIAHQPSAELYVDLNQRFNIGLKYSETISNYYNDKSAYLQMKYAF